MFGSRILGVIAVLTSIPFVAAAHLKRMDIHRRHDATSTDALSRLVKRQSYTNAQLTYFTDGTGACGVTNSPNDFIVALDSQLFDAANHCGDSITISCNGKTAQATIEDRCPGCPSGGLDLSTGLFQYFSDLSAGQIFGEWWYDGSSAPTTSTSSTPAWTPAPSTTPSPTSIASSTTWSTTSTTSSMWSSSSSSALQTTNSISSSAAVSSSSTIVSTSSGIAQGPSATNMIDLFSQAFIGMGGLAVAAAGLN